MLTAIIEGHETEDGSVLCHLPAARVEAATSIGVLA